VVAPHRFEILVPGSAESHEWAEPRGMAGSLLTNLSPYFTLSINAGLEPPVGWAGRRHQPEQSRKPSFL